MSHTNQLASNKDRSKALAALHQATMDGRLTTERFEQRTQSILESETLGDINANLQDLGIALQGAPTVYIQSEEDSPETIPDTPESEIVFSEAEPTPDIATTVENIDVPDETIIKSTKRPLLSQGTRTGMALGAVALSIFGPFGYFIHYSNQQRTQYSKDYKAMVAKQTASTLQPLADAIKNKYQKNPDQSLNQVIQQINEEQPKSNIVMNIDRSTLEPGQTLITTYGVNGYKLLVYNNAHIKVNTDTKPWTSLKANVMSSSPTVQHGDYIDSSGTEYTDTDYDY